MKIIDGCGPVQQSILSAYAQVEFGSQPFTGPPISRLKYSWLLASGTVGRSFVRSAASYLGLRRSDLLKLSIPNSGFSRCCEVRPRPMSVSDVSKASLHRTIGNVLFSLDNSRLGLRMRLGF